MFQSYHVISNHIKSHQIFSSGVSSRTSNELAALCQTAQLEQQKGVLSDPLTFTPRRLVLLSPMLSVVCKRTPDATAMSHHVTNASLMPTKTPWSVAESQH